MVYLGQQDEMTPVSVAYMTAFQPSPSNFLIEVDVPFDCIAAHLYIHANNVGLDNDDLVYEVTKNGFATALAVATTSSTQCASNTTDTTAFTEGDRLGIKITRPGGVGTSLSNVFGSVRLQPV